MVEIGGKQLRCFFANEDVVGTPETTGWRTIGDLQGEPTTRANNNLLEVHGGHLINTRAILEQHLDFGFNIDWYVQDASFVIACLGDFDTTSPVTNTSNYQHLGGTEDSTSTATVPVEHEVSNSTITFGLDAATDDVLTLAGCKCNNFSLTSSIGEPVKATGEFMFLDFDLNTTVRSANSIDYGPWAFWQSAGAFNINSSNTADVTDLTLNVSHNLKAVKGSGSRKPSTILSGDRSITGNVTLNYDNTTEIELWADNNASPTTPIADEAVAEFDIDILYDNNVTPTTGATYRAFKIEINDVKLGELQRSAPVEGDVVKETYSFVGRAAIANWWDSVNSDPW